MSPVLRLNTVPMDLDGTLFLMRADNHAIRSLHGLRGAVVSSMHPLSVYDFLLGVRYLATQGVYIYQDAKQVRFIYIYAYVRTYIHTYTVTWIHT
jgi:hypothetical protein